MVFRKSRFGWVGMISPSDLRSYRAKIYPHFFRQTWEESRSIKVLVWLWIFSSVLEIFAIKVLNSPKSCQIMHVFDPKTLFGEGPPHFWTQFSKFSLRQTTVQNFSAIGWWSSEIPWRKKKNKSTLGRLMKDLWLAKWIILIQYQYMMDRQNTWQTVKIIFNNVFKVLPNTKRPKRWGDWSPFFTLSKTPAYTQRPQIWLVVWRSW